MTVDAPCHVVAVIGGASSGSVVAELLAEQGCHVVIYDQNERPYGKIEDGLPRWHMKQRRMEYAKIDARLDRPGVTYVPLTRLGRDLDFKDLATNWGWSAVVLANGAWKDRPLDVPGAADCVDRGLVYQNAFVYWFNHKNEAAYAGPTYTVADGTIVVGGGLASIDMIKIVQLELYERALRARGIEVDMHELEHEGIPKFCQAHGIDDPQELGVVPGLLIYRRRVEDMPLAGAPKGAKQQVIDKIPLIRKKLLTKSQEKFLFRFEECRLTKEVIIEDGRARGLVLYETKVEGRNVTPIEGSEHEVRSDLIVSSIGSIPEPIPGVEMSGAYYKFKDWDTGEYEPLPNVFGAGNVVTGQGNIKASLEHGRHVAHHVAERYLGVADDDDRDSLSEGASRSAARGEAAACRVSDSLADKQPLSVEVANTLLERAHARQREVGYTGSYSDWLKKVTPPDME